MKHLMFPVRQGRKRTIIEQVLFVDPGLGGTGLAMFKEINTMNTKKKVNLPYAGSVIRGGKEKFWLTRLLNISAQYAGIIEVYKPDVVVMEHPEIWQTGKSFASAMGKSKSEPSNLTKLAILIGALVETTKRITGTTSILIAPREWNGQLPKEVVIKRIEKIAGDNLAVNIENHLADAIGMGLAAQGLL